MSYIVGIKPDEVSTTPKFTVGAIGMVAAKDARAAKKYKYVKYNPGTGVVAAVVGQVAYYYLAGGYQDSEVTSDLSDSVNIGAGVLQGIIPTSGFGWVQISGPATLTIALTAGADGNSLTPVGATDGTLDVSALVTDSICATADDISALEITCQFPE